VADERRHGQRGLAAGRQGGGEGAHGHSLLFWTEITVIIIIIIPQVLKRKST